MTAAAGCARPVAISVPRKAPRHRMVVSSFRRVEPAVRLGPVGSERIELGELVQKSRLRRDRDGDAAVAQQYRLAQLQVPVAQGQPLPLEGGQRKIGTLEEIQRLLPVGPVQMR